MQRCYCNMKKHDVKRCAGEEVKLHAFSGSVIYREDFWTSQAGSVHQDQYMMDVVRPTDGFDGGSFGPKNSLEAEWTLEMVWSLGWYRRPSVSMVLHTDRSEGGWAHRYF